VAEAERMGFRRAIIPAGSGLVPGGPGSHLSVTEVSDMKSAIAAALG